MLVLGHVGAPGLEGCRNRQMLFQMGKWVLPGAARRMTDIHGRFNPKTFMEIDSHDPVLKELVHFSGEH